MLYEVRYPAVLDRKRTALRLLLVIPLLLIWLPLQLLVAGALVAGWLAVVATRTYPRWLYAGLAGALGFGARIEAYALLMTDRYPGFGEGKGPVRLGWAEPPDRRLSRWRVALWKSALLIPHAVALILLSFAQLAVTAVAWVAILNTRRFPPDLFAFSTGVNRWRYRVLGYYASFNDRFPPFNPWPDAGPASPLTVLACGACGLAVAGLVAGILLAPAATSGDDAQDVSYVALQNNGAAQGWTFAVGPSNDPDFIVSLLSVEDPDSETARALGVGFGDRAVVFELDYENRTSSPLTVEPGSSSVSLDGEEVPPDATPVIITVAGRSAPAPIQPGERASVRFTFVIPEDAFVEALTVQPPLQSREVIFRFE
jgi:hypothetical protein